jgi:hypothetical protein
MRVRTALCVLMFVAFGFIFYEQHEIVRLEVALAAISARPVPVAYVQPVSAPCGCSLRLWPVE